MSDNALRSYNDIDGLVGQSRSHHVSNWMAHWMDRSCNTVAQGSLNYKFKEDKHDSRKRSLLGGSEIETHIHKRLVTSSQNLKAEGRDWKHESPFPPALEWARPEAETSSRNYIVQPPEETVKLHNFFEKKNLAASRSSADDFTGSSSKAVPRGVCNTTPILSMSIGGETDPSRSLLASKEHFTNNNFPSYSTFYIRENKTGYVMRPGTSLHDPSASNGQMFRESTVSAKFKGEMLSQLYSLPRDIGFRGGQGVRIQLLESSTDTEDRETIGSTKTSTVGLKNESSADTNTMEMNVSQENRLSAYPPSPCNKDLKGYQISPSPQVAMPSGRATSTDEKGTSSSRTQSLDMERLFSNTEQASDSKPNNAWPNGAMSSDPSISWLKRFQASTAPDSLARGTHNSSKMEELSSHGKANIQDQALSHHWIRRWCHDQDSGPRKNKEPVATLAPENVKETSDKFQKRQFPSIAAMTLVGKAMNGFRPGEFRKIGSSVVWNTKGF